MSSQKVADDGGIEVFATIPEQVADGLVDQRQLGRGRVLVGQGDGQAVQLKGPLGLLVNLRLNFPLLVVGDLFQLGFQQTSLPHGPVRLADRVGKGLRR